MNLTCNAIGIANELSPNNYTFLVLSSFALLFFFEEISILRYSGNFSNLRSKLVNNPKNLPFLSIFFEYVTYDHILKGVFMLESHAFFSKMVDELVEFSEYDPELSDGIKWLDAQAQKKGISFYDMVFEVLYKHDVNSKAKEWLSTRN